MDNEYKNIREIIINNPIYKYFGNLSFAEIKSILEDYEKLTENIGSNRFRKKSYYVLIELLQNATSYSVKDTEIKLFAKVFKDELFFMCENEMPGINVLALTKQINRSNEMSKEEIKEIIKSKLLNLKWDERVKGIGVIDIVRRSNNKILYNFTKIDDKSTLVSLITTIDIK